MQQNKWSNEEIANLYKMIGDYGLKDGIKNFTKQYGRSEDAVRIKLSRLNKQKAENEAVAEEVTDIPKLEQKSQQKPSFLKRIRYKLYSIFCHD